MVVDIAGGLIGQQEAWSVDHGTRDGDALLLSARQRRWARIEAIAQPDPAQQFTHMAVDFGVPTTVDAQRQRDVFNGRQMIDQAEVLKHHADSPPQRRQIIAWGQGDVLVEKMHQPARGTQSEIHKLQQRGFAGAAGPRQEME